MEAFRVVADQVETLIEDGEREVLANLTAEVTELLGIDVAQRATQLGLFSEQRAAKDSTDSTDPQWDAITRGLGMAQDPEQPLGRPADPAVERLLPAVSDDAEIDEEYRRLTQTGLRWRKGDRLVRFWVHLQPENGPLLRLEDAEAEELMAAITDIRLVIAQRLGIEEAQDLADLRRAIEFGTDQDHRAALLQISDVLAWWQESLISALQTLAGSR